MKRAFPRFLKTVLSELVPLLLILFLTDCTGLGRARNGDAGKDQEKAPVSVPAATVPGGEGEGPAEQGEAGTGASAVPGEAAPDPGSADAPQNVAQGAAAPGGVPPAAGTGNIVESSNTVSDLKTDDDTVSNGSDTVDDESDDSTAGTESPEESKESGLTPEQKVLERDISTSSFAELASMNREVGLSEAGTREELAQRLRDYYGLSRTAAEAESSSSRKDITIESARSTEYFTLEVVDEEYARLRGDVVVSLKDGDSVHRIKADEILYNRTRNIMSASGGVEYVKEGGEKVETYRGESITVNLDDWASVLMDSVSERSLASDGTTYRFAGSLIIRSDEEATIMTNATITNPANDASYGSTWSISAKKLWLLPGSDWAILNAVLKVGEIPLLWIPAFFFPADEVIFHPVLGLKPREGTFSQNTFYIWGRPTASSSSEASSLSKILGTNSDEEKVREGIFLRSTGKKAVDPNDKQFKVMADFYTNLGIYLGAKLALPAKAPFGTLDFEAGVGFTRTLYPVGGGYTPFDNNGESDWNSSNFFSTTIPLRYRFTATGSLNWTYGSLSWNIPFYSDPEVNNDFLNRSEEMDWVSMLTQGNDIDTTTSSNNSMGSYSWSLGGALNPRLQFLAPYLSGLSISNISSTLSFQSKPVPSGSGKSDRAPDYQFLYPAAFTIASFTIPLQGTLLNLGGMAKANPNSKPAEWDDPWEQAPLKNIGVPRSPWDTEEQAAKAAESTDPYNLPPPVLNARFELPRAGSTRFTIGYNLTPVFTSTMNFRHQHWLEPESVNWSEISSILTKVTANAGVSFNLSEASSGAYDVAMRLNGDATWQDYSYINKEAEEFDTDAEETAAKKLVYGGTRFTTTGTATVNLRPLFWNTMWSGTSLTYSLGSPIAQSVYKDKGTIDDSSWEWEYGEWTKEKLTTHTVGATLSASVMDKVQTLSISTALPPKEAAVTTSASLRIWNSTTTFGETITFKEGEDKPVFGLISFSETLPIIPGYSVSASFDYNPEDPVNDFSRINASLTLFNNFTTTFTMNRSKSYELDPAIGWKLSDAPEKLNPQSLNMSYSRSFGQENLWKGLFKWSLNFNTSLNFDFQRYTYSKFTFRLAATLGITKFLTLNLSTNSENAVIARYVKDWLGVDLPGESNMFLDLLKSFNFFDEGMRRQSGFKLKSFSFNLTHHLGDWDVTLGINLSPYLDNTTVGQIPAYKFNTVVNFAVKWVPISEIKTDLKYESRYETFTTTTN
ncbi:hypothetical protein AGMMS49991_07930 [Spirochaetia bacterium]|nr:hypothetical protein AGMMS49991_07930 [Spirochaetia bacterium]